MSPNTSSIKQIARISPLLLPLLLTLPCQAAPTPRDLTYPALDTFRASQTNLLIHSDTIYLKASATEILLHEPIEFILIHQNSGHGYESAAKTTVLPSALHNALTTISLNHGSSPDHQAYRFWPQGDRVLIRIHWLDPQDQKPHSHNAQDFVQVDHPITTGGWLFTGSDPFTAENGQTHYGADVAEPSALIALFNTPYTVLDLPDRNPQGRVYAERTSKTDFHLPKDHPLIITLEPLYQKPRHTLANYTLTWQPSQTNLTVTIKNPTRPTQHHSPNDMILWLRDIKDQGLDPYITLHLHPDLTLTQLHTIAQLMHTLETPQGLRILPPPKDHLYFRTYLPPDTYRIRENRPSQPIEYHINQQHITTLTDTWTDTGREITATNHPISATNTLPHILANLPDPSPTLFLYAPPSTTRQKIHTLLKPIAHHFPIIYIFQENQP